MIKKMNTTEETVEIKAGELILNVPYTTEGLKVVRAMVTLLEAGIDTPEEEKEHEDGTQAVPTSPFSTPKISAMQRIKFKNWEAIGKTTMGIIYREVIDRMLKEYKGGFEPKHETLSSIIREMYGEHLKESSIATYVSVYLRYIRENKLAIKPTQEEVKVEKCKTCQKTYIWREKANKYNREKTWFELWIRESFSIRQISNHSGHSESKLKRIKNYWLEQFLPFC